jgi:hypothetical protein
LGLNSTHGAKDGHGPVENPKASFHLDSKINVTGRVNEIYAAITPKTGRGRRGDGNAPFLLLGHPIHDRLTVVNLPYLLGNAGVKQDALASSRLTSVNMSDNANVAGVGY